MNTGVSFSLTHSGWTHRILSLLLFLFIFFPPFAFMPGSFKGQWIFTEYREVKLAAITVLFWALATFFCFFCKDSKKQLLTITYKEPTFWFLCFLCGYSFLSASWAMVPEAALYETAQWLTLTAMFLILSSLFTKESHFRDLALWTLVGAFFFVTTIGLIQTRFNISFLMPIPGTKFGSTFGAKNTCFLSLSSQFFLLCFLLWQAIQRQKIMVIIFIFSIIFFEFIYSMISLSRTTYLALATGAMTFLLLWGIISQNWSTILRAASIFLLITTVSGVTIHFFYKTYWNYIHYRITKRIIPLIQHPSTFLYNTSRGQVILDTTKMIKDHPFGVGAANWMFNYPLYRSHLTKRAFNKKIQIQKVHNDYVQYLAELGFPGFLALLGLIIFQFKRLLFLIFKKSPYSDEDQKVLGLFLCCQLVAVSVMLFFSFYLEFPYRKFLFVFLLTLIYSASGNGRQKITYSS